jgi:hypothetical protein
LFYSRKISIDDKLRHKFSSIKVFFFGQAGGFSIWPIGQFGNLFSSFGKYNQILGYFELICQFIFLTQASYKSY